MIAWYCGDGDPCCLAPTLVLRAVQAGVFAATNTNSNAPTNNFLLLQACCSMGSRISHKQELPLRVRGMHEARRIEVVNLAKVPVVPNVFPTRTLRRKFAHTEHLDPMDC